MPGQGAPSLTLLYCTFTRARLPVHVVIMLGVLTILMETDIFNFLFQQHGPIFRGILSVFPIVIPLTSVTLLNKKKRLLIPLKRNSHHKNISFLEL